VLDIESELEMFGVDSSDAHSRDVAHGADSKGEIKASLVVGSRRVLQVSDARSPARAVIVFGIETLDIGMQENLDHFVRAGDWLAIVNPGQAVSGWPIEVIDVNAKVGEDRPAEIVEASGLNGGAEECSSLGDARR